MSRDGTRCSWLVALAIALSFGAGSAWAAPQLKEVERYAQQLAELTASKTRTSLEPLFESAGALQDAVMTVGDDDLAWLERLSDAEAQSLQARLLGIRLHRGLDVHAEIDRDVLLALARKFGTTADVAFFERYAEAYNEQALPVYLRFTDRIAPCVRFDTDDLGNQYDGWRTFEREHPDRYSAFVDQWLRDIEDVIAQGTCTCTPDQAPVEASIAAFIERFPDTPALADAQERLAQLESDPYVKPVWCR